MAARIDKPGDYEVEIREPYWQLAGNAGENKMALVLPGFIKEGEEEQSIDAYLYFVPTLIQSGKNQGRAMYDINAETCVALGMPEPFNPIECAKLEGAKAKFVVDEEEYKNKKQIRVKFVNPPGRERLDDAAVTAIWDSLTGGAPPPAATGESDDDQIPFGDDENPF